jgi:hypothetical protein
VTRGPGRATRALLAAGGAAVSPTGVGTGSSPIPVPGLPGLWLPTQQ